MRALAALPAASLITLCLSCQIATAAPGSAPPHVQGLVPLPPAQRALEVRGGGLRGDAGGLGLGELLVELGDATGADFTMTAPVSQALAQTPSGLTSDVRVPAESAWTFVESILDLNGFALSPLTDGPVHLVAVLNLRQHDGVLPRYMSVPAARLEELAEHPALLVRTMLHMEYTDARHVAGSLRGALGGSAYGGVTAVGTSSSVLVAGQAHQVVELARFLLETEAAAKAQWERDRDQARQERAPSER